MKPALPKLKPITPEIAAKIRLKVSGKVSK
jgi:hypothetical protein